MFYFILYHLCLYKIIINIVIIFFVVAVVLEEVSQALLSIFGLFSFEHQCYFYVFAYQFLVVIYQLLPFS